MYAQDKENYNDSFNSYWMIGIFYVQMNLHDGEHYCVYDNRYSSFALFEGAASENLVSYQISEKYNATDHDTVFLKQIREWSSERMIHEGNFMFFLS
jgi:hypothetical protein